MPQSKKDLRKQKQKQDAAAGIVHEKKAANTSATCTQCKQTIRTTKKNIEVKTHWEAKHSGKSFLECFPGETYEGM